MTPVIVFIIGLLVLPYGNSTAASPAATGAPKSKLATISTSNKANSPTMTKTIANDAAKATPMKSTSSTRESTTIKHTPSTATLSGLIPVTVSKETDGDTIHVRLPNGQDKTIRMLLIDTPEDVKPGTPVEPYSLAAAHYAASVMPVGKHIYIQEGVLGHQLDKYGRLLAFVYVTPKDMYNEDVVRKGLARVAYIYPPNTQHLSTLEADQSYAKSHHLGIWTIPGYVTPDGYSLSVTAAYNAKHSTTRTTTPAHSTGGSLSLVSFTSSVSPRSYATVTVHAKPGTTASIEVDYKSGPSHAHGLYAQTVGSGGTVTWRWEVGSRTTPGNWPVIITDSGQTLRETLHVS